MDRNPVGNDPIRGHYHGGLLGYSCDPLLVLLHDISLCNYVDGEPNATAFETYGSDDFQICNPGQRRNCCPGRSHEVIWGPGFGSRSSALAVLHFNDDLVVLWANDHSILAAEIAARGAVVGEIPGGLRPRRAPTGYSPFVVGSAETW